MGRKALTEKDAEDFAEFAEEPQSDIAEEL